MMLRLSLHQWIISFSGRLEVVPICPGYHCSYPSRCAADSNKKMNTSRHVKTRFLHLKKSGKELASAKLEVITLVVNKTYTRLLWYFSAESCLHCHKWKELLEGLVSKYEPSILFTIPVFCCCFFWLNQANHAGDKNRGKHGNKAYNF